MCDMIIFDSIPLSEELRTVSFPVKFKQRQITLPKINIKLITKDAISHRIYVNILPPPPWTHKIQATECVSKHETDWNFLGVGDTHV